MGTDIEKKFALERNCPTNTACPSVLYIATLPTRDTSMLPSLPKDVYELTNPAAYFLIVNGIMLREYQKIPSFGPIPPSSSPS